MIKGRATAPFLCLGLYRIRITNTPLGGKQMDENDKELVPQEKHIERFNEVQMPS
jgi:hypothetical protein